MCSLLMSLRKLGAVVCFSHAVPIAMRSQVAKASS